MGSKVTTCVYFDGQGRHSASMNSGASQANVISEYIKIGEQPESV